MEYLGLDDELNKIGVLDCVLNNKDIFKRVLRLYDKVKVLLNLPFSYMVMTFFYGIMLEGDLGIPYSKVIVTGLKKGIVLTTFESYNLPLYVLLFDI